MSLGLLRGLFTVSGLSALVKLAGAVKVAVLARQFGTSEPLDAFLAAFLLPSFLAETLGASFNAALLPKLIQAREQAGRIAAEQLLTASFLRITAVLLCASIALWAVSSTAIQWTASGFSAPGRQLSRALLVTLIPVVLLSGLGSVLRGVLNAGGRFLIAAALPLFTPLVILAWLLLDANANAWSLAWGTLAGNALELVCAAMAVLRLGWRPRRGSASGVAALMRQYLGSIAWVGVSSSTPFIDQAFAGSLAAGSIAKLNFGTRLSSVLLAVGPAAVATVFLPHLSWLQARGETARIRGELRAYAIAALALAIPCVIVAAIFSEELVRFIFERGAFQRGDTREVAQIQAFSTIQIPFALLSVFMGRLLSALSANHHLAWIGAAGLAATVALDYWLSRALGTQGIALASGGVQFLAVLLLWWSLRRVMGTAA